MGGGRAPTWATFPFMGQWRGVRSSAWGSRRKNVVAKGETEC